MFFKCFIFLLCLFFPSNKIAAIVGQEIILQTDVDDYFFVQQKQGGNLNRSAVLEDLVVQKVLIYFARQDSTLFVDENQLNQMVKEQVSSYKSQFNGSVDDLEKYFGKTFSQIYDYLYEQGQDLFLANQFKQKLFSQVSISSSEVVSFYNSNLTTLEPTPPLFSYSCFEKGFEISKDRVKKTQLLADSVLYEIKTKGKPFSSFYSAFEGWEVEFKRGDFGLPEFEWAAFSLKEEGAVAGPVLTEKGFHLIQLKERLGEKIKVNHILFPLSLKEEDIKKSFSFVENKRVKSLKDLSFLDSLSRLDSFEKKSFSGVFEKAPSYLIPPEVFGVLKTLKDGDFSKTIKTKNSYFFVYLKESTPSSSPSLEEHWSQIEGLALQQKAFVFFEDWYNKNKEKIYIKVFSENY